MTDVDMGIEMVADECQDHGMLYAVCYVICLGDTDARHDGFIPVVITIISLSLSLQSLFIVVVVALL